MTLDSLPGDMFKTPAPVELPSPESSLDTEHGQEEGELPPSPKPTEPDKDLWGLTMNQPTVEQGTSDRGCHIPSRRSGPVGYAGRLQSDMHVRWPEDNRLPAYQRHSE